MANRITNSMLVNHFNRNLTGNMARMDKFQAQLATNRKIVRLSDDPVNVIKSLNARSRLASLEQYKRTLSSAQGWLTQSETAAGELNEILKRVYELSVRLANEVSTPEDRKGAAFEVKELLDHVLTVGNTTLGDKYLFGGYNVTREPFGVNAAGELTFNKASMVDPSDAAALAALDDIIHYEIGFGIDMPIQISGVDLMGKGDMNIYAKIKEFYELANSDELEDLTPFIGTFQNLQKNVLSVMAEIGGRQNRLEMMDARFDQDIINYTKMQSDVEDIDQAETIMNFSVAEAVYRAALSVGGRILPPSLVDFVR